MKNKLEEIFNIAGKRVLITGASGYLGGEISRTFLETGAKVILLGRSARLLKQTKEYQKEFGSGSARSFKVDFYNRYRLRSTLEKIVKDFDIDVLINNAYDLSNRTGFNTQGGTLENMTYAKWKDSFESGIYWAAIATEIMGKEFKKKKKGSIINVSSMYATVSPSPKLYEKTNEPPLILTARPPDVANDTYAIVKQIMKKIPFSLILKHHDAYKSQYLHGYEYYVEDRRKNAIELSEAGFKVPLIRKNYNYIPDITYKYPNIWYIDGVHSLLPHIPYFIQNQLPSVILTNSSNNIAQFIKTKKGEEK